MSTSQDDMQAAIDQAEEVVIGEHSIIVGNLLNANVESVIPFFGFEAFPAGMFDWQLKDAGFETMDTVKGKQATIFFKFDCLRVHSLKDRSIDPDEIVGREHVERVFISDVMRDIGKARAIIEACGGTWGPSLPKNLADITMRAPGATAGIVSTYIKEKDRTYSNMDVRSIKPLVNAPQAQAESQEVDATATAATAALAGLQIG